jgi:hypothetical protein
MVASFQGNTDEETSRAAKPLNSSAAETLAGAMVDDRRDAVV